MSRHIFKGAVCAMVMLVGSTHANPPLKSGPQVGSVNELSGFTPKWITGPCAGKRLCPV